jgi:hypothetical protein
MVLLVTTFSLNCAEAFKNPTTNHEPSWYDARSAVVSAMVFAAAFATVSIFAVVEAIKSTISYEF